MNARRSDFQPTRRAAARARLQRSFRDALRHFVVLAAGLLLLAPAAFSQEIEEVDDDPFDRPGFYVGVGGSYQSNVFQDTIEDELQDQLDGTALEGADFSIDDSGGLNARVGYRAASFFAAEIEYEWIDEYDIKGSDFGQTGTLYSIEGHTLTANTKWIIPFWRIQPYLLLGGGVAIADVHRGNLYDVPAIAAILIGEGIDVHSGTKTNAAARAGLGLDVYVTEHIVATTEATVVVTTLKKPDVGDVDDLNYMSFTAGLQYRF